MTTAAVALQKPKRRFKLTKRVFSYPYVLFMLLFVVIPLVMILVNAFLDADNNLTLSNFADFFTDKSSLIILANSLLVGVITTAICLIIGYPLAYILSKMPSGRVLVLFYVLPMWVNFLIRTAGAGALLCAADVGQLPHPHSRDQSDLHRHGRDARDGHGHLRHGV